MICRMGLAAANPTRRVAQTVAARATNLGVALEATLLLGLDDPYVVPAGDPGPLVAVPLLGSAQPGPLARALLTQSHAVVCCWPEEAARVARYVRSTTPLVLVALDNGGPLAPSSPMDRACINGVLRHHPDLTNSLGRREHPAGDPIDALVMACLEAVVAASERSASTHVDAIFLPARTTPDATGR